MVIRDVGRVGIAPGMPGRVRPSSGFAVAGAPGQAGGAAPMAAALGVDGLLLLQEGEDAPARDRRARQHGRALLDALARLQLGLLDGDEAADGLGQLTSLVRNAPQAADPGLRAALAAVELRAAIELARHSLVTS